MEKKREKCREEKEVETETWLTRRLCIVEWGGVTQVFPLNDKEKGELCESKCQSSLSLSFRSWSLWDLACPILLPPLHLCTFGFKETKDIRRSHMFTGNSRIGAEGHRKLLVSRHPWLPAAQIIPYFIPCVSFLLILRFCPYTSEPLMYQCCSFHCSVCVWALLPWNTGDRENETNEQRRVQPGSDALNVFKSAVLVTKTCGVVKQLLNTVV